MRYILIRQVKGTSNALTIIGTGWQVISSKYCEKILDIFAHMFAARAEISIPENRQHIDSYLMRVWRTAAELVLSFHQPSNVPDGLEGKFRSYLEFEEDRMAKKLRAEKYRIRALDTVFSIASPTRAEVGVNAGVRMEKVSRAVLNSTAGTDALGQYVVCLSIALSSAQKGSSAVPTRQNESSAR